MNGRIYRNEHFYKQNRKQKSVKREKVKLNALF